MWKILSKISNFFYAADGIKCWRICVGVGKSEEFFVLRRYSNHCIPPLKTDHRQQKESNDHYSLIPRTVITQSPSCSLRGTHQKRSLHWRPLLPVWLLNQNLQMLVFAVCESTSFLGWEKFLPRPLLSCFEVKENALPYILHAVFYTNNHKNFECT